MGTDGEASCCIEGTEPSCSDEPGGLDSDGDGVEDNGGASFCATGETEGCKDNCPFQPNNEPGNVQRDSFGTVGQGDSCECGNTTEDSSLDIFDALNIAQATLSPPIAVMNNPRACDSNGDAACSIFDALRVAQATLSPPIAAIVEDCPALVGPAP
jgi:hypothetical protein